jgi:hypothetical protein
MMLKPFRLAADSLAEPSLRTERPFSIGDPTLTNASPIRLNQSGQAAWESVGAVAGPR